jgi:pimeloyl-ACP methyl ester carboxylesterase
VKSRSGESVTHIDGRSITVRMVGDNGGRIFTQVFLPNGRPTGGVIVCSPVYAEAIRNERREFMAAIDWCSRGMAVIRFHYRGSGHSSSLADGAAFDDLVADATTASHVLLEEQGLDRLAFVGTRLGALVAAHAAVPHPDAPLVLWQPAITGNGYYREVFRAKLMGGIAQGQAVGLARSLVAEIKEQGWLDVIGYRVGLALYESSVSMSLATAPGIDGRSVLLVQMSPRSTLATEYGGLVAELEHRGCTVATCISVDDGAWWFGRNPSQGQLTVDKWTEMPATASGAFLTTEFEKRQ